MAEEPNTEQDPEIPDNPHERGELLTAEGGALRTAPALREKIAIYKTGLCLVSRLHADDNDVISALALARRLGHKLYPPKYVDLGTIRSAYAIDETKKAEGSISDTDTAMKKEAMEIYRRAAEVGTSDVHIVVQRGEGMVWFRVDGELKRYLDNPWPAAHAHQLCRTFYALADVADASYEQFAYQAARISTGLPPGIQAIRLQFNPVGFDGRQLVMRLLYARQSVGESFEKLGFAPEHIAALVRFRAEPTGIVAVSGPTGSGKSTTLERLLSYMVRENPGDHILSVEDPPEYLIPGVVQLPVANVHSDEEREGAFSEAIAAALRSDPDRVMIGEVRLKASAQLAFRAALTGHAVYTTIHSNDALGIVPRLLDIGIEPYMARDPSLVKGLLAQRLIRKICPACRKEIPLKDLPGDMGERLLKRAPDLKSVFVKGPGCPKCREGYVGRTVVAEIIIPDQTVLQFLCEGRRSEAESYWLGPLEGRNMLYHSLNKIRAGEIDPTEVERKVAIF